jgi:hypothetical protein
MAKPFKPAPKSAPAAVRPASPISAAPASRSDVRNSPLPKSNATTSSSGSSSASSKRQITHEMIARRAYEIWQSGKGGSEFENWVRAERELRGS